MKIVLWLFGAALALVLAATVILGVGSALSLDRDYTHAQTTQTLPLLSEGIDTGIVRIPSQGYEFRARVAGMTQDPQSAQTVILLHGFPVTSAMWEPLLGPLRTAGYRVIAFDQRGYSPGARPLDPSEYQIDNLVRDVALIADATDTDKFHLIGHDWGSAVGWSTVMQYPQRILSWTGMSIAHPAAFFEAVQNDPDQQARSSYFALFTTPYLPEALFTFNDLSLLKSLYASMSDEQQEEYYLTFSEPGALKSALNWYRQMGVSDPGESSNSPDIYTPTLFIWGNNDPAAGRAAVQGQQKYMKASYTEIELDGDHWLLGPHRDRIVPAVLTHLANSG